ncbi:MAG: LmeA family phospholipid-binding protein [Candidatus Sericytochromatia bacterium]|nr:LmeA family phospholipid-binding protein [Candidatus Tanganyikabacteria bacterium]
MGTAFYALLAFLAYALPYTLLALAPGAMADAAGKTLRERIDPPGAARFALDVDPPIRAAGGELDRVAVAIASATIAGALPVEYLELEARHIRFDVWAAVFDRQLVLRGPMEASGSVELTEEGLTQFVRSDLVRAQFRGLTPPRNVALPGMSGAVTRVDIVPTKVGLADGRIEVRAQVQVPDLGLAVPVAASARPILIDATHFTVAEPRVVAMGRVLGAEQLLRGAQMPIFDLADLASGDVAVRVANLEVSGGRLKVAGEATIRRLPPPQ